MLGLPVLRHRAELAFGEAFGLDGESAVEAGAGIFPRDNGGKFHELSLGEVLAQGAVELIRNIGGSMSHGHGEVESGFLTIVEMRAGFELRYLL